MGKKVAGKVMWFIIFLIMLLHAEIGTNGEHLIKSILLSYYTFISIFLIALYIALNDLFFKYIKFIKLATMVIAFTGIVFESAFIILNLLDTYSFININWMLPHSSNSIWNLQGRNPESIDSFGNILWLIPHLTALLFFICLIEFRLSRRLSFLRHFKKKRAL